MLSIMEEVEGEKGKGTGEEGRGYTVLAIEVGAKGSAANEKAKIITSQITWFRVCQSIWFAWSA